MTEPNIACCRYLFRLAAIATQETSTGQMFLAAALGVYLLGTVVGRAMVERRGIQ
jgi:hypothetical protein